jgi:protoporphyrinogen/coproporphyrinogen III oxidase
MAESRDVLVVGAGISGLTSAFHLLRGGLDVAVIEAAGRVGGAIRTLREGGWTFEQGPNTVLESRPAVGRLIREAGLEERKLAASPAAKKRFLWKGDRLLALPAGPGSFLTTPLFPASAKLRLLREPFIGRAPEGAEESIAQFVRRRLGQAFLDYAVGPFVSGVYAGDPERLSVRWAVARIYALERDHGGLIRGALAKRKGAGSGFGPGGGMVSIDGGLEELPRWLAEVVEEVRTGVASRGLRAEGGGFAVETDAGELRAREVVLAVPADALGAILDEASEGRSRAFAEIPYAPVVVASYGFRRADVRHPLDGFGFLAPRKESLRILGGLFPSTLYPDRAPEGHVAIAAFAGGRTDPGILDLDDDALHAALLADLDRALGLTGEPVVRHLARWPRAIPQYEIGHGRFVDLARALERELPGLHLAGNFIGGVSVPDCIQNATDLAERILAAAREGRV